MDRYTGLRIRHAAQTVSQLLRVMTADARLGFRLWRGGMAIRQRRMFDFDMLVPAGGHVGRQIYFYGEYEPEETAWMRSHISPDFTCFDIGANVGYYALQMASLASRGHTYAFEPVELNFHLLSASVALNGFANISVVGQAVGDVTAVRSFAVASDGAFSSLVDTGARAITSEVSVQMVSIDQYCRDNSLRRVDCMKIDVEGAEEKVLRGASCLLSDSAVRPQWMMVELNDWTLEKQGSSVRKVLSLLESFDYRGYALRGGGLERFDPERMSDVYNVFFLTE